MNTTDANYRPWRVTDGTTPALDPAAADQWRQLLDDTRRATRELRRLIAQADDLAALAARIDAIEHRLAAIEQTAGGTSDAIPFPDASAGQPGYGPAAA